MDTSQRGMGFPWSAAKELIKRSVAEARTMPGAVVFSGAGTDDLVPSPAVTLAQVEAEYEAHCSYIESVGGRIILMASRALAACAKGPEDYAKVYGRILTQAKEPVIIHWLGDMFDPALAGYWGSPDMDRATETLLAIIHEHAAKIDGVKISLLDQHARDRDAPPLPEGRAHVHGRRLRLSDDDRRRCAGPLGCAPRHLRRDRAGGGGRAARAGSRRPRRVRRGSYSRRCRSLAISSAIRRASTRPAWSSWRT